MAISNMYRVFINNFTRNNTVITTEEQVYSIPFTEGTSTFIKPKVKGEMGKTGTMEFSLYPNHELYDCWMQMFTMLRVTYDGTTIFDGRVLTVDTSRITGERKIHCEGYLAFLMDTQIEGVKDDQRPEITGLKHMKNLIKAHNDQAGRGTLNKTIKLGEVPGQYSNEIAEEQKITLDSSKRYGSGSWQETANAFGELTKNYGGYLRIRRKTESGTVNHYLDYLDTYFRNPDPLPIIEVASNVVSMDDSSEVDNIFTALIPVGSKKGEPVYITGYRSDIAGEGNYLLVPWISSVYNSSDPSSEYYSGKLNRGYHTSTEYGQAVNKYGYIFKVQSFQNADTQEKLWQYAWDWILTNYHGGITSFTVGALDMHVIGQNVTKILVGDRVKVRFPASDGSGNKIEKIMTVISIEYDLHNPENNQYTIGIPNNLVNKEYGKKASGGGGGGGGGPHQEESEVERLWAKRSNLYPESLIWEFVEDGLHNSEEYQLYKQKYGDDAAKAVQKTAYLLIEDAGSTGPFSARDTKKYDAIILDGNSGKIEINGPVGSQFEDYKNTVRSIVIDGYESKLTVRQRLEREQARITSDPKKIFEIYGADTFANVVHYKVTGNVSPVVKASVETSGDTGTVASIKQVVGDEAGTTIENLAAGTSIGTAGMDGANKSIYTSADALLKNFEASATGNNNEGTCNVGKDTTSHNWKINLNHQVQYTDINGHVQRKTGFVSAEDFQIKDSFDSLKTKFLVVDELVANKATIGELNALRADVETLSAQTISTTNLASEISRLGTVTISGVLQANSVSAGMLMVNSRSASWTDSLRVVTGVTFNRPQLRLTPARNMMTTAGGAVYGSLVTQWSQGSIDVTTKSLYFLGSAV